MWAERLQKRQGLKWRLSQISTSMGGPRPLKLFAGALALGWLIGVVLHTLMAKVSPLYCFGITTATFVAVFTIWPETRERLIGLLIASVSLLLEWVWVVRGPFAEVALVLLFSPIVIGSIVFRAYRFGERVGLVDEQQVPDYPDKKARRTRDPLGFID